jgi:hypothetical protein
MFCIIVNIIAIACSVWLVAFNVKENKMTGAALWAINCGCQVLVMMLNILHIKGI